jgi:dTDP-4-amino-4,6-dideoxygalactose transaminase
MSYKIPLFKLNFDGEEQNAVVDVLRSEWISTGPKCEELEKLFASMLGANYAVSLSNCTVALHLAMKLLDIKEGDEVICPSLTFVATVNAIRYVNATPVFADITGADDITMNPEEIRKCITPRTRAIVVMHFAGFPCQMDAIMQLAKEHNLKLIEDACHGPLSEYSGKKLGTIGDVGCFSFFSNKNISTGEGGILVTNDERLAKKAKLLRSHGMTTMSYQRASGHATEYDVIEPGFNYRMDDIHASIGIVQLKKLRADLEKRIQIREKYLDLLKFNKKIILPFASNSEFVSNYIFPIVLNGFGKEKRDHIRSLLHEKGIQTSVHYPAVHRFSIYKQYHRDLPITELVTDNEITLPMFGSLNDADIAFIAQAVNDVTQA